MPIFLSQFPLVVAPQLRVGYLLSWPLARRLCPARFRRHRRMRYALLLSFCVRAAL
jgi:hypothetical protein